MAQQNTPDGFAVALAADVLSNDRTSDLAIFSALGAEVVRQWWLESKRRWAEANNTDTFSVPPAVVHGEGR